MFLSLTEIFSIYIAQSSPQQDHILQQFLGDSKQQVSEECNRNPVNQFKPQLLLSAVEDKPF